MVMPVGPMYGNGGGSFGGWGDGSFWIIVLFLFAFMGNGWGGAWGGNGGGAMPYMMNQGTDAQLQRGFDQQSVMGGIGAIQGGISSLAQGQCSGFAGVTSAVTNGFAQAEIANNARQMADMQQSFGIQSALQQCCCDNRAATADLKYTVAQEACADRQAVTDALRDVIASNTANTQAILDKMCQQEIEALKTQNQNLQTQLNMANLAASQTGQTARILADNAAQTQALEQYLNPVPIPAYMVQNPNCCTTNYGCSCASM